MREIKFRAWYEGRMKPITTWGFAEGYIMTPKGSDDQEEYKVMQYTGLKDKNGVEIYEGDILSAFYGTQVTEVKWNAEYGLYEVALQLSGGSETADELLGNHLEVVEVIGNRYENPELLEGAK